MEENKRKKKLAPILIILSGIFWGMTGLYVRYLASYKINSLQISCIRVVSAALAMFLVVLFYDRKLFKIKPYDIWIFILSGGMSVFLTCILYFKTIMLSSLSVAVILMYTAPIFVMLISAVLFKEKLNNKKIFAMVLAFGGCMLISGVLSETTTTISAVSFILGISSGICYASYSIYGKLALRKYTPLTYTFYSFLFAAVFALFMLNYNEIFVICKDAPKLIFFFPLIGIMTSVIPYLLYTLGLNGMESGPASVLSCSDPLVASLISIFILSEGTSLSAILGIILIITSIVFLNK